MRRVPFTPLWVIAALAVVVAGVYWPSPAVYIEQWLNVANTTFTHGWLVLAVSLALIVRSRQGLLAAALRPAPLALWALAGCIFAWLVCYRASIQDLHITIFPAIFWLAVTAALGLRVGMLLAFPVAFFYFAVPSWAQLGPPLQELTVWVMHGFFWLTGPSVVISGHYVHIPNGSFVIEEGCNGLHFMIVGLAVAALHGELRNDSLKTRFAQLTLMAVLALLANWVRVYAVIEAGYLTNMQSYLVRVSHYWFGWCLFAVMLIPFFWLTTLFGSAAPSTPEHSSPPATVKPSTLFTGLAMTLFILVMLPAVSWGLRTVQAPAALAVAPAISAPANWSSAQSDTDSSWQPTFPGADQQRQFVYTNSAGQTVELYTVAYRTQRQGAELVGSGSTLTGKRFKVRSERIIDTPTGAFRETETMDHAGARSLIWSRYKIAGRDFVTPVASQLWYGLNATVSNPPATLIAYRVVCAGADCEPARRELREFIASDITSASG
jgi:EpsI family protein